MTRPVFHLRRGDRLIARMKNVLYGWRFARQAMGTTVVWWPSPGVWRAFDTTEYSASLIFDMERLAANPETADLTFRDTDERFPANRVSLYQPAYAAMRNNRFERAAFEKPGLVFHEDAALQFRFKDEPQGRAAVSADLAALHRLLPAHRDIEAMLSRIDADLDRAPFVCVHARGGDIFGMLRDDLPKLAAGDLSDERLTTIVGHYVTRTAPLELYLPWVQRALADGRKIVFSSDTPEQIGFFRDRFGPEAVVDLAAYAMPIPIRKAWIDFSVLTRARELIGTRSNFSSFACELGGGRLVTVSAAATHGLPHEHVVDLYFREAVERYLPGGADAKALDRLRAEIRRAYLFVNRIGTKEEIAAMDPRKKAGA